MVTNESLTSYDFESLGNLLFNKIIKKKSHFVNSNND